ncbi:MAG: hypothetical protein ACRYG4_07915 [Janthinobacterium lividum]
MLKPMLFVVASEAAKIVMVADACVAATSAVPTMASEVTICFIIVSGGTVFSVFPKIRSKERANSPLDRNPLIKYDPVTRFAYIRFGGVKNPDSFGAWRRGRSNVAVAADNALSMMKAAM